jgi:hypothetical protein
MSVAREMLRFVLHVVAVYLIAHFSCPWLSGEIYAWRPVFGFRSPVSRFEFLFSHIFAFTVIPGILAGMASARFRHRVAEFVWIVPAVLMIYKLLTFRTSILRGNRFLAAFHYYFGGGFSIPEFHNYRELFTQVARSYDGARGMDQLSFTGFLYAGIVYSLTAFFARRKDLRSSIAASLRGQSVEVAEAGEAPSESSN